MDWSEVRKYMEAMNWAILEIRALEEDDLAAARDIAHKYQNVPSAILDSIACSPEGDLKEDMGLDCAIKELDFSALKLLDVLFNSIANLDENMLCKVRLIADTFHHASNPHWLDPMRTGELLANVDRRSHHHGIEAYVADIKHRAGINT